MSHQAGLIALKSIGGLYSFLAVWGLVALARIHFYSKPWTTQKYLHLLVFVVSASRAVFCFIAPAWDGIFFYFSPSSTSLALGLLDTVPGLVFFAIYCLLLYKWITIYFAARQPRTCWRAKVFKSTFFFLTLALCCSSVTIDILIKTQVASLAVGSFVSSLLHAIPFFIAAVLYCICGNAVYKDLKAVPYDLTTRGRKAREILATTIICAICFLLRVSVIVIAQLGSDLHWEDLSTVTASVADVVLFSSFYVLLEILPLSILLYYNRALPPPLKEYRSPNSRSDNWRINMANTPQQKLVVYSEEPPGTVSPPRNKRPEVAQDVRRSLLQSSAQQANPYLAFGELERRSGSSPSSGSGLSQGDALFYSDAGSRSVDGTTLLKARRGSSSYSQEQGPETEASYELLVTDTEKPGPASSPAARSSTSHREIAFPDRDSGLMQQLPPSPRNSPALTTPSPDAVSPSVPSPSSADYSPSNSLPRRNGLSAFRPLR